MSALNVLQTTASQLMEALRIIEQKAAAGGASFPEVLQIVPFDPATGSIWVVFDKPIIQYCS